MVDGIIRVFEFFIVSEQVRCIDRFMFIGENNAPFDHVLQFADVTRPVVGHDGIDGSLRESGQLALVLWGGALAILGLVAFAALLEGFLWRPMAIWMRVLLLPGVVAMFWPNLAVEAAGFVLVAVLLWMNWAQARREKDLPGGPAWAQSALDG